MRARAGWTVEVDEQGAFVTWHSVRSDSRAGENDESMSVYLPCGRRIRARAANLIADALNRARIHPPRARRPVATKGGR